MSVEPYRRRRPIVALFAAALCAAAFPTQPAEAQEAPGSQSAPAAAPKNAMTSLIDRLVERGSLTKDDAVELRAQAEADAADSRVQAAEVLLAAAKADAAVARAQAAAAQAAYAMARAQAAAGQIATTQKQIAHVNAAQIAAAKAVLGLPADSPVAAVGSSSVSPEPAVAPTAPDSTDPDGSVARPAPAKSTDQDSAAIAVAAMLAPAEPSKSSAPAAAEAPVRSPAADDHAATEPPAATVAPVQVPADDQAATAPVAASPAPVQSTAANDQAATLPVAASGSPAPEVAVATNPPAAPETSSEANPADDMPAPDQGRTVDEILKQSAPAVSGAPQTAQPAVVEANGQAVRVSDALGETTPPASQGSNSTDASAPAADQGQSDLSPAAGAATASAPPEAASARQPENSAADAPVKLVDDQAAADPQTTPVATHDAASGDGTVSVAYVPEVVRNQITAEVKNEVLAQARQEGWGQGIPSWVNRFTLYGDIRVRFEDIINHSTNDNTGAFPNFNAINTGAPFDTAGNVFSPQYNVDQNRQLERLRARLGFAIDFKNGFTAGFRIATGNDGNPVTENQTFGAANNGQGGDFSKYALWLDRGYIKYQSPGDPDTSFSITAGRFENPFFATTLIWANDLGFDGFLLKLPVKVRGDEGSDSSIRPFLVAGAFPVFNTDLNFSSNQPAKFGSYDKWLDAIQVGVNWKVNADFSSKTAVALYYYKNIEGQLSTPFTPTNSSDQGNTDDSRPSFAQNGNTYMQLRDIVAGPLNDNGTIDQWQYYGLATPFHDLAITQQFTYSHFEPFDVSLTAEYVSNLAFNEQLIAAKAINNLGPTPTTGSAPFVGGRKGWFLNLLVGDALMNEAGNWNVSAGYRYLESDAVVDGFNDADFGGILTGTNLKGFTLGASVALAPGIWFESHFYSATAIAGPVYKNDMFQFDVNAKF